jgi:hypothetical protein
MNPTISLQPCPLHIRYMATPGLVQILTSTLPILLFPPQILHQPSMANMTLSQTVFPAPLAPPLARLQSSLAQVSSNGRQWLAGASGFDESGFVRPTHYLSNSYPTNLPLGYYVIGIILTLITTLTTIYHHQIVEALTPAGHWMKR